MKYIELGFMVYRKEGIPQRVTIDPGTLNNYLQKVFRKKNNYILDINLNFYNLLVDSVDHLFGPHSNILPPLVIMFYFEDRDNYLTSRDLEKIILQSLKQEGAIKTKSEIEKVDFLSLSF